MADAYNQIVQARTTAGTINTWYTITVPVGARNALIGLELSTANMRVSYDDDLSASTEGMYIAAGGAYSFEGVNSVELTIYVATDAASTIIVQYTKE